MGLDADVASGLDGYWPSTYRGADGKLEIPYQLDDGTFTVDQEDRIYDAFKLVEESGVIRFVPRTTQQNWIKFFGQATSCFNLKVGMETQGFNVINLNGYCNNPGIVAHEILHALGFWHEQQRSDRDEHVIVHFDNINCDEQYEMAVTNDTGFDYDFGSIMHYGLKQCSATTAMTPLETIPSYIIPGQREKLSDIDLEKIRTVYQCASGPRSGPADQEDYCTPDCPCWEGSLGDCDTDADCQGDLVCGNPVEPETQVCTDGIYYERDGTTTTCSAKAGTGSIASHCAGGWEEMCYFCRASAGTCFPTQTVNLPNQMCVQPKTCVQDSDCAEEYPVGERYCDDATLTCSTKLDVASWCDRDSMCSTGFCNLDSNTCQNTVFAIKNERLKWLDHHEPASNCGGYLASIRNADEDALVFALIDTHKVELVQSYLNFYLGGEDHGNNTWAWLDGSDFDYGSWWNGPPASNHWGNPKTNYICDNSCNSTMCAWCTVAQTYAVEWVAIYRLPGNFMDPTVYPDCDTATLITSNPTPLPTSAPTSAPVPTATPTSTPGDVFVIQNDRHVWSDHEYVLAANCGGHLASINSEDENNEILALVTQHQGSLVMQYPNFLLGGTNGGTDYWLWSDGSDFAYTNWKSQPGPNTWNDDLVTNVYWYPFPGPFEWSTTSKSSTILRMAIYRLPFNYMDSSTYPNCNTTSFLTG